MTLVIAPSPEAACARAAELVAALLAARPAAVLALPVGATPRPCTPSCAAGTTPASCRSRAPPPSAWTNSSASRATIRGHFTTRCATSSSTTSTSTPRASSARGAAADLDAAAAGYEQAIAGAGGIDLALLGIGGNGHIAFNEPGSPFTSRTRVVALAADTRAAAAASFGGIDAVPTDALTIGVATIRAARQCVLLAHGAGKAAIVARALEGPIGPDVPASALRLHPNATVILDAAAASRLTQPALMMMAPLSLKTE